MHARSRHFVILSLLVLPAFAAGILTGCGGKKEQADSFQWKPLFGDFAKDTTPVIAKVGDQTISERDLELYLAEMPPQLRHQFDGAEGERLALKRMIDQVIMVNAAIENEIYRDPAVARSLISLRRGTLDYAMRNVGLLKDKEPSEEEMREYYLDNKDQYRIQGRVLARHIQCASRADADAAYRRLQTGEYKDSWPFVLKDFSTNLVTKGDDGNLGWVSEGGFIPNLENPKAFQEKVIEFRKGLHEPIEVGGVWHVVEILERAEPRPQTFTEARQKLLVDMMPGFQDALVKDWLKAQRKNYDIVLSGKFAPGQGLSPDELYARALAVTDPERKVELLTLLQQDYPDHERADDALFMAGYAAMEAYKDLRVADRLLRQLLEEYPDTEYKDDAQYLRENLYNPAVQNPKSIEDLQQGK